MRTEQRLFSIARLLSMSVYTTTSIALVVACGVFTVHDYIGLRNSMAEDLRSLAVIVARNTEPSLRAGDVRGAASVLRSLESKSSLRCAALYDRRNSLFARYERTTGACESVPVDLVAGHRFIWNGVHVVHRLESGGLVLGTVYLFADMHAVDSTIKASASAAATTAVAAFCLVMLMSAMVRQTITAPILRLAATAERVSREKRYDLLVDTDSRASELRALVDGFNEMLTAIGRRDREIEARCEQVVGEMGRRADSEARVRAILDGAAEAILAVSAAGEVESANPAAAAMFGRTIEDLVGSDVTTLVAKSHWDNHPVVVGSLRAGPDDGAKAAVVEAEGRRADGTSFPIELSVSSLHQGQRRVYTAIVRDVTERRRAEAERVALEEQIRQAQKMEAIGLLAGGIAHDFNNLLVSVLGNADLAMDFADSNEALRANLSCIVEAGNRARDLVAQLLAFSRKREIEHGPMAIAVVVKSAVDLVRASIPRTIEVRTTIDPECGTIVGDAAQLGQVVINLCTNAYHAIGERPGLIEVALRPVDGRDVQGIAEEGRAPRYAELVVRDSGSGMSSETKARIFEPFFTTKEIGKGTGLGLSVVHGTVGSHGGIIDVESTLGEGTSFVIHLPLSDREVDAEKPSRRHLPGGSERILIVDDDNAVLQTTNALLERLGYRTTPIAESLPALERFRRDPDAFDLVLTDHVMPRMSGLDLAEQIQSIRPDTPLIITSAYDEGASRARARAAGVRAYLHKPYSLTDLADVVRHVLDHRNAGAAATV